MLVQNTLGLLFAVLLASGIKGNGLHPHHHLLAGHALRVDHRLPLAADSQPAVGRCESVPEELSG
jgi:hypothetical protein